jgi:ATP-dependent helicase/nuclease subunit A
VTAPGAECRPPADQAARERIRTSLDETLVVEAAAGTGKTSELVARLINVLGEGRGAVETVAAVTFTDKAAGELRLRLRAGLEAARREAPAPARRRRLEDAIARLEEARIGTIHSFCADLLRERPVEARVDPNFQVIPDPEAQELYARAFNTWMEACLTQGPPEGVRRALRRPVLHEPHPDADDRPIDRLRSAGWALAAWRHLRTPWRRPPFDRAAAIAALLGRLHALADDLGTCSKRRDRLFADTEAARRLSADIRAAEAGPFPDADRLDGLEASLIDLAHDDRFRTPRQGSDRHYPPGTARARILRDHGGLCDALDAFERDANADLAALLQAELLETLDRYEALKARGGALDFPDLLARTRDLLRDRADVRAVMQQRLTHLFVDEFQDTDPLQAEIVLLLAAADPGVSDWRRAVPVPGKLFLVGDPKQSIYRFRGADVGAYQEVKSRLCASGATLLQLTTSFRAVPSIQRLVNRAFSGVVRQDARTLQAAYVPLAPYREERGAAPAGAGAPAIAQASIVALPVPSPYGTHGGVTKTAIRASLPGAIAAFVQWLLTESGWTVTARDHPERLPVEARHVCLLLKHFSGWGEDRTQPYVDALEARAIPHLLVGGKSFHIREEVECLRTALAAIEWPDDQLSLFATLRGPLFAIGDEELLVWRARVGRLHPYARPSRDGAPAPERLAPVANALALIRDLHRLRNARPVEETIHDLLTATRAHAGFVLRPRGEQVLANVMRVADLARAYETSGGLSFRGFLERLEREAETDAPEAPILEEGSEGVRIMTVHKAKGLEFPVVILADPTANLGPAHATRYVDPGSGRCALRVAGCAPWDLVDHEADEIARERAEGIRVAYVAATRARDLLVVPVLGDDPFGGGWPGAEEGWVAPVQRAVYPHQARRHSPLDPPDGPRFGADSVLDRPAGDAPGPRTVRPGLHAIGEAADQRYAVLWWDPHALDLRAAPVSGIRHDALIRDTDPGIVAAGRRAYDQWRADRDRVLVRAGHPSMAPQPVAERVRKAGPEVDPLAATAGIVDAALGVPKPGGRRFGTLVHAVLALAPLDAAPQDIAGLTEAQGRILGAPPDEVDAAGRLVAALLAHPLLRRAEAAWRAGRCRRESPLAWLEPDGTLVEGVLDLAFEDGDGWTVLDFKTDRELGEAVEHYRRQVALYARGLAAATGRTARGLLVRL